MSNSSLLWSTFILPWLTLFFINQNELKRFLPVAWFTTVLNVLLYELGISLHLWNVAETVYPLTTTPPFFFGAYPVMTLWIFTLSYSRFGLYMTLNVIADAIFAFLFIPWLSARGIAYNSSLNYLAVFLAAISQAVIIYLYQISQEKSLPPIRESYSAGLNPAQAKPLPKDNDKE